MAELQERIEMLRFANRNSEGRYFIPEADLFQIVTESAVKLSLRSLDVPAHEVRDLTDGIMQGARKCFAILVSIDRGGAIAGFFRHDLLQHSHPDHRLPYTSEILKQVFEEDEVSPTIKRFLEKQWEFAVPILHQNMISRNLDTNVILPFLHEEPAGRGSMGTAWKIELHPQCHRLPLDKHTVIRKQIECGRNDDMAVFQKELENLSLLTHLTHPNIIQLYCSYIYRKRCNLIFAVAEGGSLADLLNGHQGMRGPTGSQLLLALTGLASAIDAMHNFTSKAMDLSLSGCHHDLAPRNILIHGETFLLADFGLSTFRNAEEDSLTTFKDVRGSYIAPESQVLRNGHVNSEKISRPSDIWSFGCILSEVLTYMVLGPTGVKQFRDKRKVQVTPEIEWFRFHKGPETPNSEALLWLDNLRAKREPFGARLVDLILEMLSIDPSKRPRSAQVLTALRGISILSLASRISPSLDSLCMTCPSIERVLDKMRFESWLFAFSQSLDNSNRVELESPRFDFPKIVEALNEMHRIIEAGVEHRKQSLLRYEHARLVEALPQHYRSVAKEQLVRHILEKGDAEQLDRLSRAMIEAGNEDIGVLLAVKRLTALAETGRLIEQEELVLDHKYITPEEDLDIHSLALLAPTSERVLVEWLRYKESWADEDIGMELRRRISTVIGLLHAESTAQIPGSLHCKGIFHDPTQRAFGVVYSPPLLGTRPVTLHRLLNAPRGRYRPVLEYRFRLAFDICQCIYTFHKVGWLHRSLHSMNVLFFPLQEAEDVEYAKEPRIVGFAGSRENRLDSFTYGPEDDIRLRNYQHPEYLTQQARYREDFDYYSVGILLLEIGLWNTLSKITQSSRFQDKSPEQFRSELIATRVPELGIAMGRRYMEATRACLEGGFARPLEDSKDNANVHFIYFKSLVIDQIPLIE
ncbi:kinase domain-containing protein [Dactylonectria macrodidyma]|uniref:Kinase domain-containing protein n=1 Tax=Dactylonectria macrodidyma TaxID=307937 RepID=A0A9P9DEK8_9HYPO|nr:kinase domain-containing protein [Dactylonectria macrodidyma]